MKKLSKEAKFNLQNIFGSLFSNKRAIEAGKTLPFWSSIIVAFLAVGLAIIPIVIGALNTNGRDFVNSAVTYGAERNIAISSIDMHNNNIRLEVGSDHLLTYYKNDVAQNDKVQGSELLSSYINVNTKQYEELTYFVNDYDGKTYSEYASKITKTQYLIGTTNVKGDADPSDSKYYIPTLIIYHKAGMAVYSFKANAATAGSSFFGDFVHIEPSEIATTFATVNNVMPTSINDVANPGYEAAVIENLKTFFDLAFLETKGRTLLYSGTIYSGVYLGLILLLGLLIFVITRGKKNFNNYLKWYQCMEISAWTSFTPGLLSMVLGFIFPGYAVMMFILFMGVRTMWLTMKQLSPTYNG